MSEKNTCKKKRHSNPNAKFNTERNKRLRAEREARKREKLIAKVATKTAREQRRALVKGWDFKKPTRKVWFEPPNWKLRLMQLRPLV